MANGNPVTAVAVNVVVFGQAIFDSPAPEQAEVVAFQFIAT